MSSHHVIRDEQEPPILIFELHDNWNQLSELLGWSPLVLIKPELKYYFEIMRTKIDGLILEEDNTLEAEEGDIILKSDNLWPSIAKWLNKKKYTGLNVFCKNDLMLSKFISIKNTIHLPINFFTESGKYILNVEPIFKKWYPKDFKLKLENSENFELSNLSKSEDYLKVIEDGMITIKSQNEYPLISEIG
ncbi:hypothetical protein QYS48_03780 [Marivirga arenosa]|uniref:Thiamine pyrophosphokinase n=1 Tax=Marivirga arenosa TaxID=3059076 RepID=A0AA49GG57_9BACT|nr:hypothetical protein [Marivirga sp. ABR2-2]WKK86129.2 hypothetical protein QYS48_03780 [Marivirga sp. ABR2-2]